MYIAKAPTISPPTPSLPHFIQYPRPHSHNRLEPHVLLILIEHEFSLPRFLISVATSDKQSLDRGSRTRSAPASSLDV